MEQFALHTEPSDEINLRELLLTIWASKRFIAVVAFVVLSIATTYAFLSSEVYETHAQTLPPTPSGLATYNMAYQLSGPAITAITSGRENRQESNAVSPLSPNDAYHVFLRHVASVTLRQEFFNSIYFPAQSNNRSEASRQRHWERFNEALTIVLPVKLEDNSLMRLSLRGGDAKTVATWANTYIEMAITKSQAELAENLGSAINLRRRSVDNQISTLRKVAKTERQGTIARLKEAATLAESIGLESPPLTGNLITSYSGPNTYLRGAKALKAELALLENRANDDPYIDELSDLLKKQSLLDSIDLSSQHVQVAVIDEPAIPPEDPIKPKKPLIMVLGLVLGLMLGIFIVSMRVAFRAR